MPSVRQLRKPGSGAGRRGFRGSSGTARTEGYHCAAQSLLQQLVEFNPLLQTVLQQLPAFTGVEQGLDAKLIKLSEWPELYFYFVADNGDLVKLACPPHDYWQINAPAFGLCSFKIIAQLPHFSNQSIIGLPLLCNYFTVFDRAVHQTGVIRCATARR